MDLNVLNRVISDFVQVGFMEAVKCYEPSQDLVRQTEVKKWLKMMLIEEKKFNALVEKGIIKPFRKGKGRNSPLFYSKKDIKQAISMANIDKIIVNDLLTNKSSLV